MAAATTQSSPEPEGAPSRWTRADGIALALLLGWVAACFAPTLGFGFVHWDDFDFVLENPLLLAPRSVPWFHHLTTPELGYPIPVTVLSYRLEHALVGFDRPWVQHGVNLVLHGINVALVFALARRLRLATLGAALAAVCFGLHPIVSEPVAWVTGRKDLLALCLALATLLLALGPASRGRRVLRAVTFVLALFAKPVALALIPVLLLVGAAQANASLAWSRRLARALAGNAAEILVAVVYLPLTWAGYQAFGGSRTGEALTTSLRSAWYGLGAHLALVVGIDRPCVQHVTPGFPPPFSAKIDLLPLAGLALALVVLRWLDGRARRLAAAALVCSLLAYLPSSGLVPLKRFLADSYLYPVLPGIAIALAVCLQAGLPPRRFRWSPVLLLAGLALALGLLVIPACGRFRSTAALWADAMERYPDSWRMCRNWAVANQEIGGPAQTLSATDRCIARFGPANFESNRAVALFELGRAVEAGAWMRRALARDPVNRNVPAALLRLASDAAAR